MSIGPDKNTTYHQVKNKNLDIVQGGVIVEQPISLSVNGKIWVTLMCTPLDIEALAVGFLFNEEIIDSMSDVKMVEVNPKMQLVDVWLNIDVEKPTEWRITSGCTGGVTAVAQSLQKSSDRSKNGKPMLASEVIELSKKMMEHQGLHQQVGGVHASALSDGNEILIHCEDIGRHNSVDKVVGKLLIDNVNPTRKVIISTGRISSEMLQKAARIGTGTVISLTSPTSLSIELAEEAGITLIGYARGKKFNIYTHPDRVLVTEE